MRPTLLLMAATLIAVLWIAGLAATAIAAITAVS